MMTSILDSAILHKTLTQTSSIWLKLIYSHSTWWWQPSWTLPSWIEPFCAKKNFTHSFWLNLMMAAILISSMLDSNTAILDSDTLLSSLRFNQKHSHSILTMTQTNSIWLKVINSQLTWWWQPSWILQSLIQPFCTKKTSLIHSDSTWWWQPSWIQPLWQKNFTCSFWLNFIMAAILNSAIMDSCILHKMNFTHSFWLNLMMAGILNSAMLDSYTALLDSDTLLSSLRFNQKHSHSILTMTQTNSIWLKLINSHSNWWWQPSWILPSWIQPFCTKKLHLFILTELHNGSHLEFCHVGFSHFAQKKLHLFILTQLDDGSHLELCYVGFRHCHHGFRHLVILSQIHSKILSLHSDSDSN